MAKAKASKQSGDRVKKADRVIKKKGELVKLISEHDGRELTSHERAYDNIIIRNSLQFVPHVALKTGDVKMHKSLKNNAVNKGITAKFLKGKVKKGDIVTFPARNCDTKTGDAQKLLTFVTSNILSKAKGIETEDLFVFYVR